MRQWLGWWLLVNVADLATTLVCVSLGGGEGNLLLKGLVHSSVWGTIGYKLLASALIGLILARFGFLGILRVCTVMVGLAAYGNSLWILALCRYGDVMNPGSSGYWWVALPAVCVVGALVAHQTLWARQGRLYSRWSRC